MTQVSKGAHSKRARILARVLEFVDLNQCEENRDWILFGDLTEYMVVPFNEGEKNGVIRDEIRSLARDIIKFSKQDSGRKLSQERTSLSVGKSQALSTLLKKYSGEAKKEFKDLIELYLAASEGSAVRGAPQGAAKEDTDDLDSRYAMEVVGKLEKILSRVARLGPVEIRRRPSQKVERYFQEAHHCYLYGFKVACAVMCRAILEESLKEVVDPKGILEGRVLYENKKSDQKKSYFKELINEAVKKRNLVDDRPEWAIKIKTAGDKAVHDLDEFKRCYPDEKLEDVLLNTRKIVEDLYGPKQAE